MTTETTRVNLAATPVVRNEFKPIAAGTYEFELGDATVKLPKDTFKDASEKELKTPYVEVQLKIFGGAIPEAGRKFTGRLLLGNTPGKDGVKNYARESGLLAVFAALGATPPEVEVLTMEKANSSGDMVRADHLNGMEVVQALQALRGERGRLYMRVKTETYNGKTEDKNEIGRFLAREA